MSESSISQFSDLSSRQRLLDVASTGSQSPERLYRSTLIRSTKKPRAEWVPLVVMIALLVMVAAFVLCLLFSFARLREEYVACSSKDPNPYATLLQEDREKLDGLSQLLMSTFDTARIRKNLRWLSKSSHLAGTPENTGLMLKLAEEYRRYGFDVRVHNYTVLLNYPDFQSPNTIEVRDEEDRWWIVSEGRGRARGPPEAQREQADFRSSTWWNAYSMNGTVEGPIVYCNYGMKEDFDRLEQWEVTLEGAIALIRYAGIPRADKIREAQKRGAVGVVLFSDPLHYTGTDKNRTFPEDIFLPGQDAQRGSTLNTHGDPLTPGLPSLTYVHRSETVESAREKGHLPKIPVMPIGYHDATYLFANMDGEVITNVQWKGGLSSPYKLTGSRHFRLHVRSRNVLRTITNVIATLPGTEEPDQWVLVGNHVDAWGTGAIDPLTGTATQLEMARVTAKTFKVASLRRSLVFCHWDAEEYGLIGSTEWLEEMQFVVGNRAVAYLNVDHIAGNVTLDVKAAPSLYRLIAEAAEKVSHPNEAEQEAGRFTLLDSWKHFRGRGPILGDRTIPEIGFPIGGSDYYRFISFAGIPSADFKLESNVGQSYALYHTMYETFWTVENLLDPYFTSMKAVGQLWMEAAHRLANELVLPMNPLHTIQMLTTMIQRVETQYMHSNVSRNFPYHDKMDRLKEAVRRLNFVARDLHLEAQEIASGEALVSITRLYQINSRLQQLEKAFLDNSAFNSPLHKHLLFGPSRHPSSQVPFLPILLDPVVDFQQSLNPADLLPLHESFTHLQYAVESVLFALKVLMNHYCPDENQRLLGFFPIPAKYACWIELLIIQLITPNASFIGHMAGILVGLLYTAGPLKWLTSIITSAVSLAGLRSQNSHEPSAPPMEEDDNRSAYAGAFSGQGAATGRGSSERRNDRYRDYTAGLSEDEQMRQAMEESLRQRQAPSYGWRN